MPTSNISAKGNAPNIAPPSMEIGQQLANMQAQEELTRKQTEVAEAQKQNIEAQTPKVNAETENLGYKNVVDKETTNTEIGKRKNEEAIGFEDVQSKNRDNAFGAETYRDRSAMIHQELQNKIFDNVLMHSQDAKINAEIPNIRATLETIIKDRINQTKNTSIREKEMYMMETEQQIKRTLERLKLNQEDTKMYLELVKGLSQAAIIKGR